MFGYSVFAKGSCVPSYVLVLKCYNLSEARPCCHFHKELTQRCHNELVPMRMGNQGWSLVLIQRLSSLPSFLSSFPVICSSHTATTKVPFRTSPVMSMCQDCALRPQKLQWVSSCLLSFETWVVVCVCVCCSFSFLCLFIQDLTKSPLLACNSLCKPC